MFSLKWQMSVLNCICIVISLNICHLPQYCFIHIVTFINSSQSSQSSNTATWTLYKESIETVFIICRRLLCKAVLTLLFDTEMSAMWSDRESVSRILEAWHEYFKLSASFINSARLVCSAWNKHKTFHTIYFRKHTLYFKAYKYIIKQSRNIYIYTDWLQIHSRRRHLWGYFCFGRVYSTWAQYGHIVQNKCRYKMHHFALLC